MPGQWCQRTSHYFNFLKLLWPFTDTLFSAKLLILGAKRKEEEGECYYKGNVLELTLISLAFMKAVRRICSQFMQKFSRRAAAKISKSSRRLFSWICCRRTLKSVCLKKWGGELWEAGWTFTIQVKMICSYQGVIVRCFPLTVQDRVVFIGLRYEVR